MDPVEVQDHLVLVVDDNPYIATLLQQALSAEGYRVVTAADGLEALARVAEDPPDLILLDLDLPRMNGSEVCQRIKNHPDTCFIPIVMITAQSAFESKLEAWEYGADDFLTKPFHLVEVATRCRSLLRVKRLVEERDSAASVVYALARAVEAKSSYTHGHSERVTSFGLALAEEVGLAASELDIIRRGGPLHDIGKISIPDAILNKPGPLTAEEFEIIRTHPGQGSHIVEPLASVRDAVPIIRWHHERMDGQGYPDRLAGEEIPLLVRILSVADVFDSLSSDRPYRVSLPLHEAREALRDNAAGGGLDPELVTLFTEVVLPRQLSVVRAFSVQEANRPREEARRTRLETTRERTVVIGEGLPKNQD
jgi:putative two-component system response regulator